MEDLCGQSPDVVGRLELRWDGAKLDPRLAVGGDRGLLGGPPAPKLPRCLSLELGCADLVSIEPLEFVLHRNPVLLLLELDELVDSLVIVSVPTRVALLSASNQP
jgi:hypothetical protein